MFSLVDLAVRVIPMDLRDKYYEIWQSDVESIAGPGNRHLHRRLQLLSIGMRLRWQDDTFRAMRLAIRILICFGLIGIYAQFGLFRDLLLLLVVWWLINRSDFRDIHSKRALKATVLHLCVSIFAFGAGLFVYLIRVHAGQVPLQGMPWLVNLGNTFVVASFVTAVGASLFWIVDFFTTTNVLMTGKIFSSLALLLLGVQWLQQSRNISELINPSPWLSDVLMPVSRIQQVTTNLVLPLLICFMSITTVMNYRTERAFRNRNRTGSRLSA